MGLTAFSFDPDFASPGDWAAMYRAFGWQVVPANMPNSSDWKFPALEWKTFQNELVPDALFARWYALNGEHAKRQNMGLLAGRCSGNIFIIDIDSYKTPAALAWWHGVMAEHNNNMELETCEQVTGGGGRQLLYEAPPGWKAPTNRTTIKVDIRGQGGFAMLPPSLHDSGNNYAWKEGHAPWEMEITKAPQWLLDAVDKLVLEHSGKEDRVSSGGPGERTESPESDFNAFGQREDGREDYMTRLVWAAVTNWYREDPNPPQREAVKQKMAEIWAIYERKVKTRLKDVSNADGLEREGRGYSLFRDKFERAIFKWDEDVATAAKTSRTSEPEPPPEVDPETGKPLPLILSAAQFIAKFTPPEYLIDGIIQRGYLYSVTARTGHGKTAVDMYIAQAIARGQLMHGKEVKSGTVLFFAGENPDDIRGRFIVLADEFKFDINSVKFRFIDGIIDVAASMARIEEEAKKIDDLVLVIVDTAAAYFPGDDTNNNTQQGAYARILRKLTFLPGKPTVLVNCHPVKNATRENLLPMGGSAFLNEVDGNLTLWANADRQTQLHWLGKFRGPEFEPITFEMETVTSDLVIDSKGRKMPSVVAKPVSEIKIQLAESKQERDETMLLGFIARNKNTSIADLAIKCNFISAAGNPQKSKVYAMCQRLVEEKLLEKRGTKFRITNKGKKEIGWEDENE